MWQTRAPWHAPGPPFKGRGEFLDQVRSRLQAGKVSAIVGAQAVHGMGGLGKTRAAIEFGLSHADKYSALLFVGADRPETPKEHPSVARDLNNLAQLLQAKVADASDRGNCAAAPSAHRVVT